MAFDGLNFNKVNGLEKLGYSKRAARTNKLVNEMRMAQEMDESFRINSDGSFTKVLRNPNTKEIVREIKLVMNENGKETIKSVTNHSVEKGSNNEPHQVKTTYVDDDGDGYADSKIEERLVDGKWVADAVQLSPINQVNIPSVKENRKMANLSAGIVSYGQ